MAATAASTSSTFREEFQKIRQHQQESASEKTPVGGVSVNAQELRLLRKFSNEAKLSLSGGMLFLIQTGLMEYASELGEDYTPTRPTRGPRQVSGKPRKKRSTSKVADNNEGTEQDQKLAAAERIRNSADNATDENEGEEEEEIEVS